MKCQIFLKRFGCLGNKKYICGKIRTTMNEYNKYIRFDWAAKRMLRDEANLKKNDLSQEVIAQSTGLLLDEIRTL